jgi:hypothetical protein
LRTTDREVGVVRLHHAMITPVPTVSAT